MFTDEEEEEEEEWTNSPSSQSSADVQNNNSSYCTSFVPPPSCEQEHDGHLQNAEQTELREWSDQRHFMSAARNPVEWGEVLFPPSLLWPLEYNEVDCPLRLFTRCLSDRAGFRLAGTTAWNPLSMSAVVREPLPLLQKTRLYLDNLRLGTCGVHVWRWRDNVRTAYLLRRPAVRSALELVVDRTSPDVVVHHILPFLGMSHVPLREEVGNGPQKTDEPLSQKWGGKRKVNPISDKNREWNKMKINTT